MTDQQTSKIWTIDDARRMAPEAFRDAIKKYPEDVEGALIFFGAAIGLGIGRWERLGGIAVFDKGTII